MRKHKLGYRQREESLFGSLTNSYGDRFTAKEEIAMKIRITSKVISYQLKLLIRTKLNLWLIIANIRHTLFLRKFKKFREVKNI